MHARRVAAIVVAALASVALNAARAGADSCPSGCHPGAPCNPSPFGANDSYVSRNTPAPVYAVARGAGFRWIRVNVAWSEMEPWAYACENGWCNWGAIDPAVDNALAQGLSVLAVFRDVPSWATESNARREECVGNSKVGPEDLPPSDAAFFQSFTRAMAAHYRNKIAAWELWNEPDLCQFYAGTKAVFRQRILVPGFDGIKGAGNPVAVVMAPGLSNVGDTSDFDGWITYQDAQTGRHVLPRNLDRYSFHAYGSVNAVKNEIDRAANYLRFNWDFSYAVTHFWLTEFGYGSHQGDQVCQWGAPPCDPGAAAVQVMSHCRAGAYCERLFYWDLIFNTPNCDVSLLNDNGTARQPKLAHVSNFMLYGTVPPCP
jgi:hypothetical protein